MLVTLSPIRLLTSPRQKSERSERGNNHLRQCVLVSAGQEKACRLPVETWFGEDLLPGEQIWAPSSGESQVSYGTAICANKIRYNKPKFEIIFQRPTTSPLRTEDVESDNDDDNTKLTTKATAPRQQLSTPPSSDIILAATHSKSSNTRKEKLCLPSEERHDRYQLKENAHLCRCLMDFMLTACGQRILSRLRSPMDSRFGWVYLDKASIPVPLISLNQKCAT